MNLNNISILKNISILSVLETQKNVLTAQKNQNKTNKDKTKYCRIYKKFPI